MSAANRRRGADAERAVVITFDPPEAPLSMNDRLHWAKRSRLTAAWRDTTAWEAMRAIPPADRPLPRCEVAVTIPFGMLSLVLFRFLQAFDFCVAQLQVVFQLVQDVGGQFFFPVRDGRQDRMAQPCRAGEFG